MQPSRRIHPPVSSFPEPLASAVHFLGRGKLLMRITWIDYLIAAVLMVFLGAAAIAQVGRSQETVNRVKCASNLRQIGQALLLYANDNRGDYPRTIWDQQN